MRYFIIAMIVMVIAIFAPKSHVKGDLRLDQIETEASKTYPSGTIQGRAWFVEMVS